MAQVRDAVGTIRATLAAGKAQHAAEVARRLLAMGTGIEEVHSLAASVLLAAGDHAGARAAWAQVPPTPERLLGRLVCAVKLRDLADARALAAAIRVRDPRNPEAAHWLEVAESQARAGGPDAIVRPLPTTDLPAFALLRRGELAEGFALLHRLADALRADHPGARWLQSRGRVVPRWDGSRVGHLVLVAGQGHGDALQFVRYAFEARHMVDRLTVVSHGPLVPLLVRSGLDAVAIWALDDALATADAQHECMFVPCVSAPDYGPTAGYLHATAAVPSLGPGLHVGVNWLSSVGSDRSAKADDLAPLASVRGVTFHCLVHGERAQTGPAWLRPLVVGDYCQTADTMAALDLVITVDTNTAHLSGALGRPTWVALPSAVTDWRWQTDPQRSAWYSTARLFRGPQCFARMADELQNLAEPWATSEQVFTPEECARLLAELARLPTQRGGLAGGTADEFEALQTFVHPADPAMSWAGPRIAAAVQRAEQQLRTGAQGIRESGHLLRYGAGGLFKWHRDDNGDGKRRLSMTLQLSDSASYVGGDLLLNAPGGQRWVTADRRAGVLTCFRADALHSVTEVTSGERASLVFWAT